MQIEEYKERGPVEIEYVILYPNNWRTKRPSIMQKVTIICFIESNMKRVHFLLQLLLDLEIYARGAITYNFKHVKCISNLSKNFVVESHPFVRPI